VIGRPKVNGLAGNLDLLHLLVPSVPVPTELPLVGTIHDLTPLLLPDCFDWRTRWLVGRALRQLARQAVRVIAVSERTRQDACGRLGLSPERVITIHQGLPTDARAQPEQSVREARQRYGLGDLPYILFVGEVTRRKNPLLLVEAFATVCRELPSCQLLLVGSLGLGADVVRRRIDALGLERRARLLGHLPRQDLLALLTGAAVFALPSQYEGFGLPDLEALACGTPVVVSDGGALPEIVGEAGFIVADPSPETLSAALLRVLRDELIARRLRQLGPCRARRFTWRRAAERTLAVYADALAA
jgi:glycosyltransferase involved in cell wall biosynthesis